MQPFGRNRYGPTIGGCAPLREGELGSHNVARAEAYTSDYPHAKFHFDPSNRLATVHERHRQDRQAGQTGLIA